ncbi:MAG: CBS domain-containing protein [Gammaproteobacteria bacterium]|jgi:predicted transcriptional regulator|nr:CBS domain-containing protein [Gammaproteobacteria bacterium]MBT3722026.1 CBS domain-containing protein [Gammaproteobacteria bacterium]MBT4075891.1 CBS domain-containing protein [Gammaproteobacteria bacterium]MBT4193110.1 CBS domain-containing protein [Gammaproteobacteria bacterium]MBT4449479.1 CBS domain-containing protein [Gammaproteobacteria bacterium]
MSNKTLIRVRDVMKTDYELVHGMETVAEVLKKGEFTETKCIIVDKRHDDDEYGLVMLSDIAKKVLARDKSPERVNIYEIMSKPVISVGPDMDIRYCARMFENFGLGRAPVVENRKILGIVGYTDIVLRGIRDRLV